MSRYRLASPARTDLDQIWSYVARNSSMQRADRLLASLADCFTMLSRTPQLGRARTDFCAGARSFPSGEYVIYYSKIRGRVVISRVIHGARDQKSAWITPPS